MIIFSKKAGYCFTVALLIMSFLAYSTSFAYATSFQNLNTNQNIVQNNLAIIDYSNASNGTISVRYTGGTNRQIVVEIIRNDRRQGSGKSYLYRINSDGLAEQLVLSEGSGQYTITVLRGVSSGRHDIILTTTIEVTLRCEFAPFLQPNKFVNFTTDGFVAELAEQLKRGSDVETIRATFRYVQRNINYYFALVRRGVPDWYEPNLEMLLLETRRGICFDFASLMTALLRINDIPAKMVFGYLDGKYWHAWVNVYLPEYGWVILDPTKNIGDERVLQMTRIAGRQHFYESNFTAVQFF